MHKLKYLFTLISLIWLTACGPKTGSSGGLVSWIDAPLDGMVLPLASYNIVAHASDPTDISQIEISVNDTVIGTIAGSGALFTATQAWTPSAPGKYLIRVRGMNSGGGWSDYAEAIVVVQGEAVSTSISVTVTPESNPTSSLPTFVLVNNANCRFGPNVVFEVVNSALAGASVPIEGKNEDGTWWLVRLPNGDLCWMSGSTGNPNGSLGNIPFVQGPPMPIPPEPTEIPPASTLAPQGCYVYDPNQQPVCTLPCPPNAVPGGACTP